MSPDFVVATRRHTPISTRLVADDRTAWRELGRFDGTPLATTWIPPHFSVQHDADANEDAGGLPDVIYSGASAPVVSAKAAQVFKAWWGQQAELLPLRADVGEWFAINPLRLVSVIDADRSVVRRFENSGALCIPGGWADLPPLPGTEVTLESEGQSRTTLTVSCTPGDGPPPLEVAVAVAALGDGELDPSPPRHFTAAGRPAAAAQAFAIDGKGGAVSTDLTGVELGMVMGLAAHDLLIEHLN